MAKVKSNPLDHELLGRLMKEHGHTTETLADLFGISDSTTGRWRSGKHGPSGAEAITLSRLFKVTTWELYGWPPSRVEDLINRVDRLPGDARERIFAKIEDWLDGAAASTPPPAAAETDPPEETPLHELERLHAEGLRRKAELAEKKNPRPTKKPARKK